MPRFFPRLPIAGALLAASGLTPAVILAATFAFPPSAQAETARTPLTITVTDIKEHKGALMVAVYDAAGYDADKPVASLMIPVAGASASDTVQLPPGQYGIKLFHDVDGDGKMGMNAFGMPVEPFAFSNSAPAQFGPAKWDAAAFTVAAPATAHAIKMP